FSSCFLLLLSSLCLSFLFSSSVPLRYLLSFPTRRSSDLFGYLSALLSETYVHFGHLSALLSKTYVRFGHLSALLSENQNLLTLGLLVILLENFFLLE